MRSRWVSQKRRSICSCCGSLGGEPDQKQVILRFWYLLAQTMIVGGFPMVVRLNHYGRLDTRLARICYRAVRVDIECHAHSVSRALVQVRGLRVLTSADSLARNEPVQV